MSGSLKIARMNHHLSDMLPWEDPKCNHLASYVSSACTNKKELPTFRMERMSDEALERATNEGFHWKAFQTCPIYQWRVNRCLSVECQLPPADAGGLLLVSATPAGMVSLNRNDWLVDSSLKYSDLPNTSMFLAALRSAWSWKLHSRQWKIEPFLLFLLMYPHMEHFWDVYLGST